MINNKRLKLYYKKVVSLETNHFLCIYSIDLKNTVSIFKNSMVLLLIYFYIKPMLFLTMPWLHKLRWSTAYFTAHLSYPHYLTMRPHRYLFVHSQNHFQDKISTRLMRLVWGFLGGVHNSKYQTTVNQYQYRIHKCIGINVKFAENFTFTNSATMSLPDEPKTIHLALVYLRLTMEEKI